jgi:hypothetical protein
MTSIDWQHDTLDRIRVLIEQTDADSVEEAKWAKASNPAGVPTWSHDGIICTGEIYKDKVKVTFMHGASLDDPDRLFNASLDAGSRRAIDIVEDSKLDEPSFKALIRAAVELNVGRAAARRLK